jgi:hypothetical protein
MILGIKLKIKFENKGFLLILVFWMIFGYGENG